MGIDWPAGTRCAVTLTFDVDGETLWLSRDVANKDKPSVLSQGAYSPKVAVPLILDMLARFRVAATILSPAGSRRPTRTVSAPSTSPATRWPITATCTSGPIPLIQR